MLWYFNAALVSLPAYLYIVVDIEEGTIDDSIQSRTMNSDIRAVQRRERHIAHRMKSIAFDARRLEGKLAMMEDAFEVEDAVTLRFLANERCGSWYLPSKSYFRRRHLLADEGGNGEEAHHAVPTTCYFKSSDGHYGQWAFSTTRLNLAVLRPLLIDLLSHQDTSATPSSRGSVTVVVDATQHGKAFPDSLSKTLPMWACVMNEVYCGSEANAASMLPPWLHPSEVNSIIQRLPSFAASFRAVCPPSVSPASVRLDCPLSTVWVHGEDDDATWRQAVDTVLQRCVNHHVLVLVCASGDPHWGSPNESSMNTVTGRQGWSYVRGAADDHESWGMGLTCDVFWEHVDALTDAALSLDDVETVVSEIVTKARSLATTPSASPQDMRKELLSALSTAIHIPVPRRTTLTLQTVVGVDRQSHLCSPLKSFEVLNAAASAASSATQHRSVIMLIDGKRKDPAPTWTLFPAIDVVVVEVDCTSAKFGIQRALPSCLEWLDGALRRTIESDAPAHISLMCVDAERDGHIVAAVAVAMLAHLEPSARHTKASLRVHQAAVADALGPRCIHRTDMIQLNRHFLSSECE
jgi:hypothetical protein